MKRYEIAPEEFHARKARIIKLCSPFLVGNASERTEHFMQDRDRAFLAAVHSGYPNYPRSVEYHTMQGDMDIVAHSFVVDDIVHSNGSTDAKLNELKVFFEEKYPDMASLYMAHFNNEFLRNELMEFG